MNEIEFQFEELPLITEQGLDAALVDGIATIRYGADREWSVSEIALDGHRFRPIEERAIAQSMGQTLPLFERKPVALCKDSNPWLYQTIIDRLENSRFRLSIEDAIAENIEAERDDYRAQLGKDRAKGLEL